MRFSSESGQSTIEAAVLLPVLFALFGLLLQPALLLYDRCIMNAAAAEGCRLLATNTSDETSVRAFVERRLDAIPKVAVFHMDEDWNITWSSEQSGAASMCIVNHVEPLPLFGIVAGLANDIDENGAIEQRVEASCASVPEWARSDYAPASWIGAWK